jgi:hypothetical protein
MRRPNHLELSVHVRVHHLNTQLVPFLVNRFEFYTLVGLELFMWIALSRKSSSNPYRYTWWTAVLYSKNVRYFICCSTYLHPVCIWIHFRWTKFPFFYLGASATVIKMNNALFRKGFVHRYLFLTLFLFLWYFRLYNSRNFQLFQLLCSTKFDFIFIHLVILCFSCNVFFKTCEMFETVFILFKI